MTGCAAAKPGHLHSYSADVPASVPYAPVPPFAAPVRKVGAPLAAIVGLGTIAALLLTLITAVNPAGTVLGFALSTAAMAGVVLCYLWLDRWEPEPPRLLMLAFLWGASVAVVLSVAFEHLLSVSLTGTAEGAHKPSLVTAAVGAPLVEEAAKGLFLLLMMTGRRRIELNTLTDCLVYAGFTAVGFAWLENIFYIAGGESITHSLTIAGLRLAIGPFAHPLFTTMFGIGVYCAMQQRGALARTACLLAGYVAAVVMHGLWNGSALLGARAYLGVYVLWMMPIFALGITLAVLSRRRERRIIAGKMPGMIAERLVTPAEAAWVTSLSQRRAAVRIARRQGGRRAASAVKSFFTQVVSLAYVRDRIDRGFGDQRVFALQNEEAYGVVAARAAAAPVLDQLAYRIPAR